MLVINTGKYVAKQRNRVGWQQNKLKDALADTAYYDPVIHRLEKGEMLPRPDILPKILETVGAPMVKILWKEAGLTLADLCQGICSESTLSKFENNKTGVDLQFVRRIELSLFVHANGIEHPDYEVCCLMYCV